MARLGRFSRLLVIVGVVAGCSAASVVAVPALATNEYYKCESCTGKNAPDNYVKNNFVINHSGGGACTYMFEKVSGNWYEMSGSYCVSGGNTAYECQVFEVYGHGRVTSSSAGLLLGRQDNFTKCE